MSAVGGDRLPPEQAHGRWPWCTLDWGAPGAPAGARLVCRRCQTVRCHVGLPTSAGPARLATFAIEHSACTEGCAPPTARPAPAPVAPARAATPRPRRATVAVEDPELVLLAEGDRPGAVVALRKRTGCTLGEAHRALAAIDPLRPSAALDEPAAVAPGITPEQYDQLVSLVRFAEDREQWAGGADLLTRAGVLARHLRYQPVEDKRDRLPRAFTAEGLGFDALDVHGRARGLREHCEEFRPIRGRVVIYNWDAVLPRKRRLVPGTASIVTAHQRDTWRGAGAVPWFKVDLSLFYWLACPDADAQDRALHHLLMAFGVTDADPDSEEPQEPCLMPFDVAEYLATVKRFGAGPADVAFVRQCVETSEGTLRRAGVLWPRPEAAAPTPPARAPRPPPPDPAAGDDVI